MFIFGMFDLFISLHPLVLIFFCLCVLACVFVSLHPCILRFMHPCLHPCMLISSGSDALTCNLVSSHPYIVKVMYFVCCWYPHILTSSYPQVHVLWVILGILAFSHPHFQNFRCQKLFRKLESDKNNGCNEKKRALWKQIMYLSNF